MNADFPPLPFHEPRIKKRRTEKPRPIGIDPNIAAKREALTAALRKQIAPISAKLSSLTPEQRRAVFLKLTHGKYLPKNTFVGTGLKLISMPGEHVTLAVPNKDGDLSALDRKLQALGTEPLKTIVIGGKKLSLHPYQNLGFLTSVTEATAKDRLAVPLLKNYAKLVKKSHFIYEIEITSSESSSKARRHDLDVKVEKLETFLGGIKGSIYDKDYDYGSVRLVLWSTGDGFRELVESAEWLTVITYFDERPRFETFHSILKDFRFQDLGKIERPGSDASIVCIVDSGVTPGNPFLKQVVKEEFLKSYIPGKDSPYDECGHGSGVASLASYYALNIDAGAVNHGKVWIASARVLNESGQLDTELSEENSITQYVKEAKLLSNLLKQIVADFKPLGVKIFVLPFHFYDRLWNEEGKLLVPRTAWVARTIDELSYKEDVTFVLITGNILRDSVKELHKKEAYPKYLLHEESRIADPGQAALALTVGSVAHSARVVGDQGSPIALEGQPSPFTRSGLGIGGALKPDVVERGGNTIIQSSLGIVRSNPGTDVVMASNKITPAIQHDSGTSFAAPRVAHHLAITQQELLSLGIAEPSACLVKAFLANSCRWGNEEGENADHVQTIMKQLGGREWQRVLGLGVPSSERAVYCDDFSSLLYFDGTLRPDNVAYFDIPVPLELKDGTGTNRLTLTVCYAPPVQRWGLEEYLGVRAKFRVFSGNVSPYDIENSMSVSENEDEPDTEDVEKPNELPGKIGINVRSRGTLQHDIFEWTRHREEMSVHNYTLAVAASRARWGGKKLPPVSLAVVVRLEDTSRTVAVVNARVEEALVRVRANA